jgi:endonuclease YncB( thermonuclease family)/predicted flap endonuclease-1-like 5' DNA nuclease
MLRAFSSYTIGIVVVCVLWFTSFGFSAQAKSKEWIVLKGCRLIANPANDGDSFHVSVGDKEYLFRLYFVDTPETDEMTPSRLVKQAKYFAITVPQAIEVGRAAKEFALEKLSEPFTALTHMSDAMGQSRLERFYAFVETKQGDLGEQLVRNGLARVYGFKTVPPGLRESRAESAKLQQFEDAARQEKIGAWGVNVGRLNVRAASPSQFTVFAPAEQRQSRTTPATSPVVLSSTPNSAVQIPSPHTTATHASRAKESTPLGHIDVNTATEKELRTVPGIGPVMASRIIAARPFRSADDLKKVNGIGDKNYARIRPYFQ